jgi:uncharacterized protein YjbI with pentapeptide repeats
MTIPNELQQRKAYEFYQKRLKSGEAGSSEMDWQRAGKYLEKQKFIVWWWHLRKRRKAVSNFLFTDLPKNELMKLLGVPVILVIATGIITDNLQKNAKNNEIARQLEATQNERLIKYFDEMQDLIFNHKLMEAKPPKETVAIARTKTLTAIRLLDNKRNQALTGFLQDSNFLTGNKPIISLNDAYLSDAQLAKTNLKGANLKEAKLENVNLENANLEDANLENTNLTNANLQNAKLGFANLRNANLRNANLTNAKLIAVNLQKANLNGANFNDTDDLTPAKIKSACFWEKAIYKSDKNENQKFIEEVRNDSSSNPKELPECRNDK